MKKVFVLEFDGWDSPVSYYFSTRKKAEDFARKHKSKYRWVIHSYPVDRQRICKYDGFV